MPLIKAYNIDSDLYGLKGHSIFKSVCNTEASRRGRPSATKHRPNSSPFRGARSFFVTSLIREKSLFKLRGAKGPKNTFPELVVEKRFNFPTRSGPTL
jgi:hypothetical protein